ncbi:sugar ABC transporter substrate-binding protein [Allorhizobium undicola]|uniref:sugar ABC transporter substrate-binding protein n=1 Tax=Allorhizobium undicola TaxID=78527 RepID=UPI000685F3D8|nr:sugar ABC transporter substrate-binding protein [Allorhizobium undicola]
MKTAIKLACAFGALVLSSELADAETRIGVTMTSFNNPFLTILMNGMRDQAAQMKDVSLQMEDANLDVSRQINQVQNFIASGVDAIIVNAIDGEMSPTITKMVHSAGIPLIYVNHPPADLESLPEKAVFVGSNELDSGTMETQAVCKLMGGKGKAFVMMGPLENIAARVRTDDIHNVLKSDACKGITVIDEKVANWSRGEAVDLMNNWMTSGQTFDAVIANNDEMAIGAIQAMKAAGMDMKKVVVAGIDATPDGLSAMKAGDLDVTVFQNASKQGAVSVDSAAKLAKGEKVDTKLWVPFELVTPENMEKYARK